MEKLIALFEPLVKPRTIFAFMIYITFCILSLTGKIEPKVVVEVVLIVIAFYYGQQTVNGK